ncbi:helix-turn-helix domain-containing protein [Pedobacter miscanthi]|uniref:helix-turn-helix domain-containing protein n=1 Tax=Pedobacter miscanthi TaxID=2259170 RepID=UPI00292DEBEE|nr:helix-turn-helix domain-containing protein [Pedobacter miscanthi]
METFGFDKLPDVVREIYEKIEHIEDLLLSINQQPIEENEFLNVKEAAEFLKITVPAIYTKVSRREIPASKPGRKLYFQKSVLKTWIANSKLKTKEDLKKEAEDRMKGYRKYFGG